MKSDPAVNGWATEKNKPTAKKTCRGYPGQELYTNRENGLVPIDARVSQKFQGYATIGSRIFEAGFSFQTDKERAMTLVLSNEEVARLLPMEAAMEALEPAYCDLARGEALSPARRDMLAPLAGASVPFLCVETHELGEEIVASYLYQVHLYHWLEENDYGRHIADDDL